MTKLLFIIIYLSIFLAQDTPLFTMKDSVYFDKDMFDFYGMSSWNRSSKEQKNKMVEDFIIREGAYLSSLEEGLDLTPSFKQKSYNKKRQLLVNFLYQYEISKMVMDSIRYELGKEYLRKDLLIKTIDSVIDQSLNNTKYEIVVVDNNSSDDSLKFLNDEFPNIKVIKN